MLDGAGVGLNVAHQRLHRGRDDGPVVLVVLGGELGVEDRRDPLLQVEAQLVLPAARGEVQGRAQPQHEIDGPGLGLGLPGRHLAYRPQSLRGRDPEARLGGPPPYAQIADAAWPVLEVRFEHENGVAEARVPALLLLAQPRHQAVRRGPRHARLVAGQKVGGQPLVADQKTGVEQRGRGRQVLLGQAQPIGHRAHGLAGIDLGVPQRHQDGMRQGLDLGVGFLGTEEEQVQVGIRGQLTAAEAAGGEHGHPRGATDPGLGEVEGQHLADGVLDRGGQRVRDVEARRSPRNLASSRGERGPDARGDPGGVWASAAGRAHGVAGIHTLSDRRCRIDPLHPLGGIFRLSPPAEGSKISWQKLTCRR